MKNIIEFSPVIVQCVSCFKTYSDQCSASIFGTKQKLLDGHGCIKVNWIATKIKKSKSSNSTVIYP